MTLRRYVDWVCRDALPFWAENAFDPGTGLFREKLHLDGTPDTSADIRIRTHMRQVYVFAHAAHLGLMPRDTALATATAALRTMRDRAWAPDGIPGWAHRLTYSGDLVDAHRDLYDHAFVLHALAWMAKATGDATYRVWIDETLAAIDTLMAAPAGGWAESDKHELPRRQNPHMHLFEANQALYETSGEARHLARAAELAGLFRTRFFDETLATLREFFGPEWQLGDSYGSGRFEPGHMVEWVWLLRRYERSTAQPVARHTAALFASAEQIGMDRAGFLLDEVDISGRPLSNGRRLWPQTEYLKACMVEFETRGDRSLLDNGNAMAERVCHTYLQGAKPGLWIDRFDLEGKIAVDHVPASILYHLFAPVVEYLRLETQLG